MFRRAQSPSGAPERCPARKPWEAVRLDRQTVDSVTRFEKEILRYPQVLECYLVAGDWDYVLRVVARDLDDFREFCVNRLAKIAGVGNVKSNISMKQVKYSTALPLRA
jgi:DNA-binding Lrp family transcriptional regulator